MCEVIVSRQAAIEDLFIKHQVKTIIHGHTHRPALAELAAGAQDDAHTQR